MSETYVLSPDWNFLAERLEEEKESELAEKARNQNLSKKEVYGTVMPIIS